jgi:2-polyprenyl-6-hydroxyphenyl methylase/3-demethylubiquinone-9 3-methyltransferase
MSETENFNSELPLEKRFGFGKNWAKFIDSHFSETRIDSSIEVFKKFTSIEGLDDVTFLDIGCGSGLHSLSAFKMGAKKLVSFDFDPNAVETTSRLRTMVGSPANWKVSQGSILDLPFVRGLGKFDFVYSWGVLHHTGAVWKAIENASSLVGPQGRMYLALYSLDVQPNAGYWLTTKEKYVNSSPVKKRIMEQRYLYTYYYGSSVLKYLSGLFKKEKGRTRGMELMTDVRDWLGGWPMEFVLDDEVVNFVERLGFQLTNVKKGEACTEFLFVKVD